MRETKFLLLLMLLISISSVLQAYDPTTHGEIAQRASEPSVSSVDTILKSELGLPNGVLEIFPGLSRPGLRNLLQLIGDGAEFEDVPNRRSFNHFHNPLRPWEDAGLTSSIFGIDILHGQSSVLWQQNTSQNSTFVFTPLPLLSGGGDWSWQDTRRHYFNALTRPRKEDREDEPGRDTAFVETFEALGRLTHLIQDASVPAHVRNDPHPRLLRNPDWYEDWVEETRKGDPDIFQSLLNKYDKDLHRPPFSIFSPTGNTEAPVPIARLIDNELFNATNFSVLSDLNIGISEYTNGNFLSRDRIFTDFTLPRTFSLDLNDTIIEPVGTKWRRYFRKVREGETVDHFVTEGLLFESLFAALGTPPPSGGWTMDDRVQEDYAAKLIPRAVGYSAGLLDYFFRGKLDVNLVEDPVDPSVIRLSGTNGSSDPLVDGTLTLYADGPDGTRSLVPAMDPTTISNVAPEQEILSSRFQLTEEADRFVAVYQGTLGNEVKDPDNNFPGAVIGKVLGGVRVESIYPESDKRLLRTVDGVFPLPPTTDELEAIQWGDQDNTFVGIKSFTPNSPDQVIAFKINRPLGSGEVPLVDGTQVVSANILKTVNFPFGLSLGTTVNYSQTFHIQQVQLTFDVIETKVFDEQQRIYNVVSHQVTTPVAKIVLDETISFGQNFPIVLDLAHLCILPCRDFGNFIGFGGIRPYIWRVTEVGFDAQGRLLALIEVNLTEPENNFRTIDLVGANLFGNSTRSIVGGFQLSGLWALIDVERGEVLGVTSSSTVSLSSQHAISETSLKEHRISTHIGGTLDGTTNETLRGVRGRFFGNPDFPTVEAGTIRLPTSGLLSESLTGRFRDDLKPLASTTTGISTIESESPLIFLVDDFTETNRVIRHISTLSFRTGTFTFSPDARIIRPTTGASPELLLLFSQAELEIFSEQGLLVRWSPQSPSNTALALPEKLPPADFYDLQFTTSEAALIEFEDLEEFEPFTLVVDFANKKTQTLPGEFLSFEYILLDPKFLYNINDTRFHTVNPSLRPTPIPRRLAVAPPLLPPQAAYHSIRLR